MASDRAKGCDSVMVHIGVEKGGSTAEAKFKMRQCANGVGDTNQLMHIGLRNKAPKRQVQFQ